MQLTQERALARMTKGPHLLDPHTIIVPSDWYNPAAKECWRKQGFVWNGGAQIWKRDIRWPACNGRRYSASAWLNWTRRKFYQDFWPELQRTCRYCRQKFVPHNIYDIICTECRKGEQYDD